MPGCDYSADVRSFANAMAASPRHLTAALKQVMPLLLVVDEQIEKYDMPGEFAFLPWVESSYSMIPPNGDGVAGMWQLMPDTAREVGLRVDAEYDGRLDVYASSRTALVLLKQYQEEFGDWRLANMAFNAGENSVRQALGKRQSISPAEIAKLRLNTTTYEHLTKLLAIACVISAPDRFHVELPEPSADDVLTLMELPAPLDLHLAAQLAHVDLAQLRRWNPAYLKSRMPQSGPFHLLVPATRRAAMENTLAKLPQYAWRDWREMKLRQPQSVETLEHGLRPGCRRAGGNQWRGNGRDLANRNPAPASGAHRQPRSRRSPAVRGYSAGVQGNPVGGYVHGPPRRHALGDRPALSSAHGRSAAMEPAAARRDLAPRTTPVAQPAANRRSAALADGNHPRTALGLKSRVG